MTASREEGLVYEDLAGWGSGSEGMRKRLDALGHPAALRCCRVRLDGVLPLQVYALLVEFIAERPNGFLTYLMRPGSKPAENLVWWDFVLSSPVHLVAVHSGMNGLAADVYEAPAGFDVEEFLAQNCRRHRARIEARIARFERHEVYANQYYTYRHTADWLRQELAALDVSEPVLTSGEVLDHAAVESALEKLRSFGPTAMKHHVLAKSLVMNSAFSCEALVSTLLRLGALPHLVRDRVTLRPLLRSNFVQKLEVLHAYTILFDRPLNLRAPVVAEVRKLMERRNKYVHAEQSEHTRLDDVYFDGDYPLYGAERGQVLEFYRRTWLAPSKEEAFQAADCAGRFRDFVLAALRSENRVEIEHVLEQPQHGYNLQSGRNSVVYPVTSFQSLFVNGRRNSDDADASGRDERSEGQGFVVALDGGTVATVPVGSAEGDP